jgi:carboxypeptidase Q
MKNISFLFFLWLGSFLTIHSQNDANQIIRKHGLEQSKVMELAGWMTDVYGPRLTGSPMLDKATDWALKTLTDWGMSNVHLHQWGPFGRGWELEHFEMHTTAPSYFPIIGYPKAWSPSTGSVSGEVVYIEATDAKDLEKYKGKLKGKFILFDTIRPINEWFNAPAERNTPEELLDLANAPSPTPRPGSGNFNSARFSFNQTLWEFIEKEEPLAVLDRNYKGDLGTVFATGARAASGDVRANDKKIVPQITLSVEHYNRIFRLWQKGIPVTLNLDLKARYTNEDGMEHNIIAEIPGSDLADEVVIFGAHYDSWHTGTGATDNAAGSSVMMEAARILKAMIDETGIKPRRTLRLALWTGEEQGLFGSRAYVADHYAEVVNRTVQSIKPEQKKVSAYYNLDNGTGKIRGVYLQGNADVAPIFRTWLDAFKDMDATTLTLSNTGGTDHLAFDAAGIPGFQFIQDPIAYSTRTHHSNMDNWDHLIEDDLKQAATIIASFVWHTSQRDALLPRKQLDLGQ